MTSKRTRATDITPKTRREVLNRDWHMCIFCKHTEALTMAHIIPRSAGGLGKASNLVTACSVCHEMLDHSKNRSLMLQYAKDYINKFNYEEENIFQKGE